MKKFILLTANNGIIGKKALISVDDIIFVADQDNGAAVCLRDEVTLVVRESAEDIFNSMK